MRPVQIRTAAPEEAPLITPLCAEHAAYERADFEHEEHASRLAAMMSGPVPRIVIFVAELDAHEIIGYAAVSTLCVMSSQQKVISLRVLISRLSPTCITLIRQSS
jgi:hypothetical protein